MNRLESDFIKQNVYEYDEQTVFSIIENLNTKQKIFLLEQLWKKYWPYIEFSKLSEIEKKLWSNHFGDIAREWFSA